MGLTRKSARVSAVLLAGVILGSCTDFSSTPELLGRVTVHVTDENNVGIPGVSVDLLLTNKITRWRNLETGSDGRGEFDTANGGVIPQTYFVRVLLTGEDYQIAPGETNDKQITVVVGQTINVVFKLAPRGVGPPTP